MALAKKQPASTVAASFADPNTPSKSTSHPQPQSASAAFMTRKPVKPTAASAFSNSDVKSSSASTSTSDSSRHSTSSTTGPSVSVNAHRRGFVSDASGMGQGMVAQPAKTFQESQDELFSKLEDLAATKTKMNPLDKGPPGSVSTSQRVMKRSTGFPPTTPTRTTPNNNNNNNKSITFNQGQSRQATGNSSTASLKPQMRRSSTNFQQQSKGYGYVPAYFLKEMSINGQCKADHTSDLTAHLCIFVTRLLRSGGAQSGSMSMTYNPPAPERPRE